MTVKRITSAFLAILMLCSVVTGSMLSVSADESQAVITLSDAQQDATIDEVIPQNQFTDAAQALDKEYAYDGNDLGCTYTKNATTFKVWAPTASAVKVNLYATGSDLEEGNAKIGTYDLRKDMNGYKWTGCWTLTLQGDHLNVYYTYTVTSKALVTNKENTFETVDPYAKAVGVNGKRAMVVDLDATDPEGWDKDAHVLVQEQTDAIVWEVVIRDFSSSATSGVSEENRGKYLAFTEDGTTLNGEGNIATCIDYLKELGITHVQINPMFDFATVNETKPLDNQYNWGYDPENYNVPEGSYSSNPYDGNVRINECKQMIQALHEAGIGVIMDVVYNHVYSAGQSNFQRIVPNYYFRFQDKGAWVSGSGCGNDTASERAMFRKFMVDSCRYWVEEYHIDGFRFDLMGVHDVETMNLIREELDKIDSRIIMYGEGWEAENTLYDYTTCAGTKTLGANQKNAQYLSNRIACFNDEIRDHIKGEVFNLEEKGFVQGEGLAYMGVVNSILANTVGEEVEWLATSPSQTVTYTSCHDNHALYDRLVASVYGKDSEYRQRYNDLIAMNKISAGIVLTSQGISFMMAGEEMARSKDGDTNSYKSSPELNAIDWELLTENADLVSYYRGLIDIRNAFSPFTESTNKYADSYTIFADTKEIVNENPTSSADEIIYSADLIGFTVKNDTQGEWKELAVIFNVSSEDKTVVIDTDTQSFVVLANKDYAGLDAIKVVKGNEITVAAGSMMILVDEANYNAAGIKSTDGKVYINHVDSSTGTVIATDIITGAVGSGYDVKLPAKELLEYDFAEVAGTVTGKYAESDTVVTYLYNKYVAPSLKNADIDGNGRVAIGDATIIQKHLAGIVSLTDDKQTLGDVDYNGTMNIKDATMIQKHLAGFDVSIGQLNANFYMILEDGTQELVSSESMQYRVGAEYKVKPIKISKYAVKKELTTNAQGVLPTGTTTVNFYYEKAESGVTIYAAHLDTAQEWIPSIWAWSSKGNAFSSWPGGKMTEGEDGWYVLDTNLPTDDFSLIVSNNGSPQTADYTGLGGTEVWIVIDDSKVANQGKFITIYDEEPNLEALRAEYAQQ